MKYFFFYLIFAGASLVGHAQEYPLTMTPGEGTQVNLSMQGDELTISMTSRDYPANAGVYQVNVCDINFIGGGELASYNYPYTEYYFLKVSFGLKRGGRYRVIRQPSDPYYDERPMNYVNAVDGNTVGVNEPCLEFDGQWRESEDKSCSSIFVILQAFKGDVNRLYDWRNMLLKKVRACGSGKIVYQRYCFSCKYERLVHGNNPTFVPHLDDCDDREGGPFDSQEQFNQYRYAILDKSTVALSTGSNAAGNDLALNAAGMVEKGFALFNASAYEDAFRWFSKAAVLNDPRAQNLIGQMYQNGLGIQQNETEAIRYYQRSALGGSINSHYNLGSIYIGKGNDSKDESEKQQYYQEALKWLLPAAKSGDADSQNLLAHLYMYGKGVTKDYNAAFQWLQQAVGKGHVKSQADLGDLYYNGWGTTQDKHKAFALYQLAGDKGDDWMKYTLGVKFKNGWNVTADPHEAIKWFQKASDAGNTLAARNLEELLKSQPATAAPPADAEAYFTGGDLSTYLQTNVRRDAIPSGMEGKVFVQFEVTENGKITNARVVKGICEACDKEALRLVTEMPAWIPARKGGKNISSKLVLPIKF